MANVFITVMLCYFYFPSTLFFPRFFFQFPSELSKALRPFTTFFFMTSGLSRAAKEREKMKNQSVLQQKAKKNV
jgi:hypothetical protein